MTLADGRTATIRKHMVDGHLATVVDGAVSSLTELYDRVARDAWDRAGAASPPLDLVLAGDADEVAVIGIVAFEFQQQEERREERLLSAAMIDSLWELDAARLHLATLDIDPTSPVFRASGTPEQIRLLARNPVVRALQLDQGEMTMGGEYYPAVRALIPNSVGWDGSGIDLCIHDPSVPDDYSWLTGVAGVAGGGTLGSHPRLMAGLLRKKYEGVSLYGTTPDVNMWFSHNAYAGPGTSEEWCLQTAGAEVVAQAFSHTDADKNDGVEIYVQNLYQDYLTLTFPYSMFTHAAGNRATNPNFQWPAARGFNGLVVGGSDSVNTNTRHDDVMWDDSAWRNVPVVGLPRRELPEIAAPAVALTTTGVTVSGTSGSSPLVAGAIALINERNAGIRSYPEAQKAVVMAASDCNLDGGHLYLSPTLDHRDGVGLVNYERSVALTDPSHWTPGGGSYTNRGVSFGYMSLGSDFPNGVFNRVFNARTTSTGQLMIALAWDATPSCANSPCTTHGPDADLDLVVRDASTGDVVAFSTSARNNYEVVTRHFSFLPNRDYQIEVHMNSPQTAGTYYGLAWMDHPAFGCQDQ